MAKQKNNTSSENEDLNSDFEDFMNQVENMEPAEARILFQQMIEAMEEEGDTIPFTLRLLTSDVIYGLVETPVGLAYGIGGLGQLLLTGFIHPDDIEEWGGIDGILQEIIDDFAESFPMLTIVRNDEEVGAMITSALNGTYTVLNDLFHSMDATDLQRAVWQELTNIPYGTTISYEELAARINNPKAVRAVATAVGDNPISIAIPCHRVIRKTGEIGDYHWGSDIKEKLLAYEQAHKQA